MSGDGTAGLDSSSTPPPVCQVGVALAPEQFEVVKQALEKEPDTGTWLTLDNVMKLLQMAAIILAALWTLNEYLDFKRDSQRLQLQRDDVDVKQRQVELRLAQLDENLKRAEASLMSDAPIDFVVHTVIERQAGSVYKTKLQIRAVNNTNRVIDVRQSHLRVFIGRLTEPLKAGVPQRLNGPINDPGPIRWTQVADDTYLSPAEARSLQPLDLDMRIGPPAFGPISPKAGDHVFSVEHRIDAAPDLWIAFIESFSVNEAGTNTRAYEFWQWRAFSELGRQDSLGNAVDDPITKP